MSGLNHLDKLQIHLNTRDAYEYYGNSSYQFYFRPIVVPQNHYIFISLQSAIIPTTFYNINNSNHVLNYIQLDAENETLTTTLLYVPIGNYNALQLCKYMTANLPNTTASYDIITNKITFVNSLYNFIIDTTFSTILDVIGFFGNPFNFGQISVDKTLSSTKLCNFAFSPCLCLYSNIISPSFQAGSNTNTSRILGTIPNNAPPNSFIFWENPSDYQINMYSNNFNSIEFGLYDMNGTPVSLNGQHYQITLELECYRL